MKPVAVQMASRLHRSWNQIVLPEQMRQLQEILCTHLQTAVNIDSIDMKAHAELMID